MAHLGAPEAACWYDTSVTQETLLSSASASDTLTKHLCQFLFCANHGYTLWVYDRLPEYCFLFEWGKTRDCLFCFVVVGESVKLSVVHWRIELLKHILQSNTGLCQ